MPNRQPDSTAEFLPQAPPSSVDSVVPPCEQYLRRLITSSIILPEDWDKLPEATQQFLLQQRNTAHLLDGLARHGLLTDYQVQRIVRGQRFGLVIGNYRVLDRLGSGGMANVFKAEHIELRKIVAVKAVEILDLHDPEFLKRFTAEMRMVAQLQHPNLVAATDAGQCHETGSDGQTLWYYVMDCVPGENLEHLVRDGGPLDPQLACDVVHQIASALAEANKRNLVHRDIKPSNILLTPSGQAKLLDFGLARNLTSRDTRRGALLGTVEFMSPEQALDATTVDIRSDIFSLGATMFWCLTGQRPFPEKASVYQALLERQNGLAPRLRDVCPSMSAELDEVVAGMMAMKADERFLNPELVMEALEPLLKTDTRGQHSNRSRSNSVAELLLTLPATGSESHAGHRVLLVSEAAPPRDACRRALAKDSITCDMVTNGLDALQAINARSYDALLVDLDSTVKNGSEICKRLRSNATTPHQKIIAIVPTEESDEAARLMFKYINDFLTKPFSDIQLRARVLAALCAKDHSENADRLNQHLLADNRQKKDKPMLKPLSEPPSEWIVN